MYDVTITLRVEAEDELDVEIKVDSTLDLVSHIDPAYGFEMKEVEDEDV